MTRLLKQEGMVGLQDRSSRRKRLRQPTPAEVIERIASLRRQRMPGKEIATTAGVSPATVSACQLPRALAIVGIFRSRARRTSSRLASEASSVF